MFRLVFAQMAASCAALDEALTKASDSMEVCPAPHDLLIVAYYICCMYTPLMHAHSHEAISNPECHYRKECPMFASSCHCLGGAPDVRAVCGGVPARSNMRTCG